MTTEKQVLPQVCIVDDDTDFLRLVTTYFAKHLPEWGPSVTFTDAAAASTWLDANRTLILVCDLEMNGRNGFQLLKRVKQQDPLTPVIVLTGHASRNALRTTLQLGADDFFVKPGNPFDLLTSVRFLVMRASRWRSTTSDGVPESQELEAIIELLL